MHTTKAWRIVFVNHREQKMYGYFTKGYLKKDMSMFHTVCEVEYCDVPEKAYLNYGYVVRDENTTRKPYENLTIPKIAFIKANMQEAARFVYRPYSRYDTELRKYIETARTEIGYSKKTASCDILRFLMYTYDELISQ